MCVLVSGVCIWDVNVLGCILTHVEHDLPGYYRYYHSYRYGESKDGKANDKGHVTSARGGSAFGGSDKTVAARPQI